MSKVDVLFVDLLNCAFTLKHFKEKDVTWRFMTDIRDIMSAWKFNKCVFCCDTGRSRYRLSMYPQYKESRIARRESATVAEKEELQVFFDEVNKLKEIAPKFGIETAAIPGVEADDILAYFAINTNSGRYRASLLSSDTDIFQLLRPNVRQRSYAEKMKLLDKDVPAQTWVTEKLFTDAYQLTPQQYMEAKSIAGDKGDSIYSPEAVGTTTGMKLIQRYGTIDEVEKNLDDLDIPRFSIKGREALKKDFWMVRRNVELVSLLHGPSKFEEIFGKEGLTQLEDILARIEEPPVVDDKWIKEYLFENGKVSVFENFGVWSNPFLGGM